MNFIECIQMMLSRPGYLGVLQGRRVIYISHSGYLLDRTKLKQVYPNFSCMDVLATTWEVWTEAQLEEMVRQEGQT